MEWLLVPKFLRLQTIGNVILPRTFLPVPNLFYSTNGFSVILVIERLFGYKKCYGRCLWSHRGWDLYEHLIPQQDPKLVSLFWRV